MTDRPQPQAKRLVLTIESDDQEAIGTAAYEYGRFSLNLQLTLERAGIDKSKFSIRFRAEDEEGNRVP